MVAPSKAMSDVGRNLSLLSLLALQVGVQPVLMKLYAKDTNSVSVRVGVIEALKFLFAVLPLVLKGEILEEITTWRFRTALKTTILPSIIYVIQNFLNQSAVMAVDGVTFNILNQTKILWTAILVYVMLGKRQSYPQVVALIGLLFGAVLMTTASSGSSKGTENSESSTSLLQDMTKFVGVVQALIAAVLSGIAGTIIQRALQNEKRNPYMVTIELSTFGVAALVVSGIYSGELYKFFFDNNGSDSIWDGWSAGTWFAMFTQAIGGIVVGFVIKFCGNVEKSFAVVAGLICTTVLEAVINQEPFGLQGLMAVAVVALSTVVYTKYPYTTKNDDQLMTTKNDTRNPSENDHRAEVVCSIELGQRKRIGSHHDKDILSQESDLCLDGTEENDALLRSEYSSRKAQLLKEESKRDGRDSPLRGGRIRVNRLSMEQIDDL